jgi:hypothetical protein
MIHKSGALKLSDKGKKLILTKEKIERERERERESESERERNRKQ